MKKKIIIFTATYNESQNIINFIHSLEQLELDLDLLIIDDNSPDKTFEVIEKYVSKNIKIKLIKRPSKLGLDSAHKIAYNYAIDNDFDYLITMDADMSHDPQLIPIYLKNLENYKFVIGSRYMKGGKCEMSGLRLILSYYGNKFIKFVTKINCSEFTSSYRGFDLKNLKDFNLNIVKSTGYSFFMETVYQINKKNIFIKEIPIFFKDRKYGSSKISKIEIFRTLLNLFRIKFLS